MNRIKGLDKTTVGYEHDKLLFYLMFEIIQIGLYYLIYNFF